MTSAASGASSPKHDLSALAAVIAAELAQDGKWYNGRVVYVTDEHGNEIGGVPVVTAISVECRSLPQLKTTAGKTVLVLTTVKAGR